MVRKEYHVALVSEQAASVAYDPDAILRADHEPHSVGRVLGGLNLRLASLQQALFRDQSLAVGQPAECELHLDVF